MNSSSYDAVVVGSGPNGLAAAIVAARCGLSTVVFEGSDRVGGGTRSAELTIPGFLHDTCSAVHPMARASELFRQLPLEEFGLRWITPPAAAAHPLDSGEAVLLWNGLEETAARLGKDRGRYLRTIGWIARRWPRFGDAVLRPPGLAWRPLDMKFFGAQALLPARTYARLVFSSERGRALFAGNAAHSVLPLTHLGSSAVGLVLAAVGHVHGWPVPEGGSGAIADALAGYFRSLGGEIVTGRMIREADELPPSRVLLFATSPRMMASILGDRLPRSYGRKLERYRYGPGAFKVDWALSEPIPWKADECREAATVHVGGTLEEIAASERAAWSDAAAERPFVLLTQPSLFDDTRTPRGKHAAWGYCHVPNGSEADMTERIEAQIERFAPGFRDIVLARAVRPPSLLEEENPNVVGGDVGGGANDLGNIFFRPTRRLYSTPLRGVYLCSAATPPGGGVHGMCGYNAAIRAIRKEMGKEALAASGLV